VKSERPDPGQADDLEQFIRMLGHLRVWAGSPSFRTLAKRVGPLLRPPQTMAQSTIGDVFQPRRRRLDLDLVVALVRALEPDEAEVVRWRDACVRVLAGKAVAERQAWLRQLPGEPAAFTGRERELSAIVGAVGEAPVRGSTVVISAIDGMAGVGKSALAVRAAHLLSDRFPDGQLFLDLHGYTQGVAPRDPADALASLLTSLGVPPGRIPNDLDARSAAYRARLAGTRTLILLDNAVAEAQVRPLIPGHGGCLVLITSRRRLKALDAAHSVALDVLPVPDAIALLRTIVEPTRAPVQDPGWQQIADLCGCLPLALRIAAALIRHRPAWTLGHLADRLREAPLDLGPFTDGERDLSAVFDLSYQTLADDRRDLLRRLGLTPGPDVDAYAAAALLGTDPGRAERLLEDLVDHHLLTEPTTGRYRMHDLIRAYAHSLAMAVDPEPERERALDCLLHYYAHTAQTASHAIARCPRPERGGPGPAHLPDLSDPDGARAWLRAEHPGLDAAFTHAHTHGLDGHAVALAAGLADILHTDGPWSRAVDLHRTAAETAERLGQSAAQATALTDLGRVHQLTGDHPEAVDAHTRALGIYRAIGDRNGEATALNNLGRVWYVAGDHSAGSDALTRALGVYRAIGNRLGEANALTDLGRVRFVTGDFPAALDAHTRALAIYRAIDHRDGVAGSLACMGRVWYLTGDHPAAVDAQTRALEIYRSIGNRLGEATTLTALGQMWYLTGDYPAAVDAQTRALEIYRSIGNRLGEATTLDGLGRVRVGAGDYPAAVDAHILALEIYCAIGNRNGEATTLTDLGRVRKSAGDYSEAIDAHTRALRIYRETGERGNEAWALNHFAATVAATGDRPRALALYQQALAMNQELNRPDDEAISLEGIGDHHLATGDTPHGTTHLRRAWEIYQRLGMDRDVQRLQARLADLARRHPPGAGHVPR
jgi:tetratricopeptide (TPR) repeat protein